MFERWKEAKRKIDLEKYEADRTRAILETSLLRQHFYKWKSSTEQRMKIRPMIMRQQSAMLLEYVQVLSAIVMLFVCQSVQ
jgi:hypothetical protein